MSTWTTIESDPAVFTELIETFGCKDIEVEELYSLDADHFRELHPVYGLIFLFKWQGNPGGRAGTLEVDNQSVFFARQVVTNACASQAILSVLMNLDSSIDLGPNLQEFKEQTKGFPADVKGMAIEGNDIIRVAHNSFARPEPFSIEVSSSKGSEDVYHFITYMPINGCVYELDGLQEGPINHGPCTSDNWLDKVRPVIQKRIEQHSNSEIHFNLMACIGNRKKALLQKCEALTKEKATIQESLQQSPENAQLSARLQAIDNELGHQQTALMAEQVRREAWAKENLQRKHNFVPFFSEFMKILAEQGHLVPLIQKAKEKQKK